MLRFLLYSGLLFGAWACGSRSADQPLFRHLPSSGTGIAFNNRISESDSLNVLEFEYLYNGGGVGIGDFDNDGRQDIFFTGNQVSCRLYLNRGALRFEDVTETKGVKTTAWCTGVTVVDINQDGWADIYVSVAGPDSSRRANLLFINQGKRNPAAGIQFREQAREYGLADTGYSTQTAFFDYDHDGDLDAYVLTNALERRSRNALRPKRVNGEGPSNDRLYRNEGPGPQGHPVFTNVTRQAGILTEGYGLGIAVADLNGDGWEDVYCANDFLSNDLVWVNNQNGTFTNRAAEYFKHQTYNSMGVDIADANNDGLPDVVVVDMLPATNERQKMMLPGSNYDRFKMDLRMGYQPQYMRNTLQMSTELGAWSEIAYLAGVAATDWSWAPLLADFDNDGYRDLLITNGYRRDVTNLDFTAYLADLNAGGFGDSKAARQKAYHQLQRLPEVKLPDVCYRNRGDLTFEDVSERWGFNKPSYSNGAAYADLDNDGDLDVVINNLDDEAFVYENTLNAPAAQSGGEAKAASWLRVAFDHRAAQGTRVNLYGQGQRQTAEFNPTRGYVSSVEPFLHFGLGKSVRVDSVEIVWTTGQVQRIRSVMANQTLRISYAPTERAHQTSVPTPPACFEALSTSAVGLAYDHVESEFNDFARTPLLPHKHSQTGPPLAVGDADGNGLDDVFVGADFGQPSYLFLQQANGRFTKTTLPKAPNQEDTGALFFDADGDNDLDLYVVSGGSHVEGESDAYQDRLYRNDGKGRFALDAAALPSLHTSGSCVVASDVDRDGDLDLFRGSRLNPGRYPLPVTSFLLKNESGRFVDATRRMAPELQRIGLVTAAVWADFNADTWPDLLLTGEWMAPTFFKNEKGKLTHSVTPSLDHSTGWWNTLVAHDFDRDGDVDVMAGNLGLNARHQATPERPVELYAADFDHNGSIDPVMTHYNGRQKNLSPTRDILTFQVPAMKRRFPDFHSYATSTFADAFTTEELNPAYHVQSTEMRSMYFENTGGGQFAAHPLPMEAQVSPVYGILVADFNHDGADDALLVGNSYAAETIGGWYDASKGTVLLGNGRGRFKPLRSSGLKADQDAKAVAGLRRSDGSTWVLVTNNNGPLQVFRYRSPVPDRSALVAVQGRTVQHGAIQHRTRIHRKLE